MIKSEGIELTDEGQMMLAERMGAFDMYCRETENDDQKESGSEYQAMLRQQQQQWESTLPRGPEAEDLSNCNDQQESDLPGRQPDEEKSGVPTIDECVVIGAGSRSRQRLDMMESRTRHDRDLNTLRSWG